MTPAEWLALAVIASVIYGVIENIVDSDAVTVKVNNPLAALFRLSFGVTIIILALVVAI